MKLDLHLHTNYSPDSLNTVRDIAAKSSKLGIVPALTDHGNTNAHAAAEEAGLEFIPGEEMKTKAGDLIGLFLTEQIEDRRDFLETLDRIREQGAIAYVPHMYDTTRQGVSSEELAKKADIIEVLNGHCTRACNDKALAFAERNGKLRGAGSDAHLIFEFGRCWIEVEDFDIENPKEFLKAVKKGKICGEAKPTIKGVHAVVKAAKKVFRI